MAGTKKLLEYAVYLTAFILPFQTRLVFAEKQLAGGHWEYGIIALYVVDIILVAALFLLAAYHLKGKDRKREEDFKIPLFWWLLSGWDLMVFISIFVAEDHVLALYRYAVFLLGVGLAALIVYAPIKRIKLIYFLVAGLVFHALWGMGQFFFQYAPACKFLGMAEHDPAQPGVFVVETAEKGGDAGRWLRAYGGLDHPNILGGILVVGFLILLAVISRRYFENKDKQALGYLAAVILAAGAFFTFSRAAGLALVVGSSVFLLSLVWRKRWRALKASFSVLAVVFVLLAVLSLGYKDLVGTRLAGGTPLENRSSQERMDSYGSAVEIIKENPVFGTGVGNYTLALSEQQKGGESWQYQPVHNTFLLIGAEAGIPALLFFVGIITYLLVQSWRRGNTLNLAILASLVIMLMVDHWWWSLHFGMLFLGLVLGVLFKNLKAISKQSAVNSKQ